MTQNFSSAKLNPGFSVLCLLLLTVILLAGASSASIICDHCGRQITGQYIQYESGTYHVHCYENHLALRCAVCGGVIDGQYFVDSRDNIFHEFHQSEFSKCEYCGCFICEDLTGTGQRFADGREVCGLCAETAVNDIEEAEQLMYNAVAGLRKFGIDIDEEEIPLELVDVQEMRRINKGSVDNPLGYTTFKKTSFLAGLVDTKDYKIYMLHGMPRATYVFSVTHELMHVWLFKNAPLDMAPLLCEGSCDYAATLVILASGKPEAAQLQREAMENPDPIYGEGLRQVDAYVTRVGIRTWLEYLTEHTTPPW
jgi:hypothetical protein